MLVWVDIWDDPACWPHFMLRRSLEVSLRWQFSFVTMPVHAVVLEVIVIATTVYQEDGTRAVREMWKKYIIQIK